MWSDGQSSRCSKLQGAAAGARASFLQGSLSAHTDAKHVLQQLLIHADRFLVDSDHPDHFFLSAANVDLGTFNCFQMAPSDFADSFKSILGTFRSMLSSSDFPAVVFCVKWVCCIKQTLLKWAMKNQQLLSSRITQKVFRGHATKTVWFTQLSIITYIVHVIVCMYLASLIWSHFQETHNEFRFEANFFLMWQCSSLIPSQKNENCRNPWNWNLPWYTFYLEVYFYT